MEERNLRSRVEGAKRRCLTNHRATFEAARLRHHKLLLGRAFVAVSLPISSPPWLIISVKISSEAGTFGGLIPSP